MRAKQFFYVGLVVLVTFLSGCAAPIGPEVRIEATNDCVDGAQSILVTVRAVIPHGIAATFPDGVTFYVGFFDEVGPIVQPLGGDLYRVSLPARSLVPGGIPLGGSALVGARFSPFYVEGALLDAVFSGLPPDSALAASPPCPVSSAPSVVPGQETSLGLVLRISNEADPSRLPFTLESLQWAGATDLLELSELRWGNSMLESLPWVELTGGQSYTLSPGQPPLVFDVPDQALSQYPVGFVRAAISQPSAPVSISSGVTPMKGVCQFVVAQPIPVAPLTWSQVKEIYK